MVALKMDFSEFIIIVSIAKMKSFHSVIKMLNRSKPVSCKHGSLQNRLSNTLFILLMLKNYKLTGIYLNIRINSYLIASCNKVNYYY